jgi:hypothetical protein
MLLRPGFFLDRVQAPYESLPSETLFQVFDDLDDNAVVRMVITGPDMNGSIRSRTMAFDAGPRGVDAESRFEAAVGLPVIIEDGRVIAEEPLDFNSQIARTLSNLDFYTDPPVTIESIEVATERMPRQIFYIPAFAIFALVWWLQSRRVRAATA